MSVMENILTANPQVDVVFGINDDTIFGGAHSDTIYGEGGGDTIYGCVFY